MEHADHIITKESIGAFRAWLAGEEREPGTIEKYSRDLGFFSAWLNGAPLTKESFAGWKESLLLKGNKPVTVNAKIAAVNTYCRFCGLDVRVKFLRIQKKLFQEESRNLKKGEYERLVKAAEKAGKERLALLMETIGSTGIRVSEVKYLTVEAARAGRCEISLKGKIRTILLPKALCRKLLKFAQKQKIASGEIFLAKSGRGMSRKLIWALMKGLCREAGVAATKVFPHNLRHLFARVFYRATRDVAKLADLLGHSSIETTRVYLLSTGEEHARQLESLGLLVGTKY